jgi:putative ABC transport system ATP-binding protein
VNRRTNCNRELGQVLIETHALSREYQMGNHTLRALKNVNLTIRAGEFLALMGTSGSGKSTLMHQLGCLDTPSSGTYLLEGRDVSQLSEPEKAVIRNRRLGFVFQNFFLLPGLTALENTALPLHYNQHVSDAGQRAAAALERVSLSSRMEHKPTQMSGGERQRVAIARALVTQPVILLADEPTGNLDSETGLEILDIFTGLWRSGLTILLVTHDPGVAEHAQRVLTMRDGQIIHEECKDVISK